MENGEVDGMTLEQASSVHTYESGEREYQVGPFTPYSVVRGAWPYLLLIVSSGLFIAVEALGLSQQGLGRYLYLGGCIATGALGILGLLIWVYSEIASSREDLRLANLVATADGLHSEIESTSPCFHLHWKAVSYWSGMIASEMCLPELDIRNIRRAAEIMDIGMLDILDEIGTGAADELARKLIEEHPVMSESVLRRIHPGWEILPLVRHHHEHFDGAGYPDGLKGEEIPIGSRILAVADSLVAMASERGYRERCKPEDMVEELHRHSGGQLDPRCVEALMRVNARIPCAFEDPRKVL